MELWLGLEEQVSTLPSGFYSAIHRSIAKVSGNTHQAAKLRVTFASARTPLGETAASTEVCNNDSSNAKIPRH